VIYWWYLWYSDCTMVVFGYIMMLFGCIVAVLGCILICIVVVLGCIVMVLVVQLLYSGGFTGDIECRVVHGTRLYSSGIES